MSFRVYWPRSESFLGRMVEQGGFHDFRLDVFEIAVGPLKGTGPTNGIHATYDSTEQRCAPYRR